MNLIDKTSLPEKQKGDGLKYSEVNSINNTLNAVVDIVNCYLKKYCDLNAEFGESTAYSLSEAIDKVPEERRSLGFTIKFLGINGEYEVYTFIGRNTLADTWVNNNNWCPDNNNIDGGIWV